MNKKLYRSNSDKMIGGVAGGLAEYFDIDSTLMRVIFVIITLLGGSGVIAYIILWIVIPERPYVYNMPSSSSSSTDTSSQQTANAEYVNPNPDPVTAYKDRMIKQKQKRSAIGGVILIIIGLFFLADELFPRIDFGDIIPVGLIIIGVVLLLNASKKD